MGSHVQLHLLRVCGSSAAHREIMNLRVRGKGRSQFWELAMAPFTPPAQGLGGTWGCNEFLFWVPILVTILGTCFGTLCSHTLFSINNLRGYHVWSQFWEPLLVTVLGTHFLLRCGKFGGVGNIAAHISTPRPCRHDEQTTNASQRANSNTAARAYRTAWRAALFDLARRAALVLSVPKAFHKFW